MAGLRATAALSDNAARQGAVLLANLCAQNQMVQLRLSRQLPPAGDSGSACAQAGRAFQITQSVRPTPNPNFRRVNVSVSEDGRSITQVVAIVGNN